MDSHGIPLMTTEGAPVTEKPSKGPLEAAEGLSTTTRIFVFLLVLAVAFFIYTRSRRANTGDLHEKSMA